MGREKTFDELDALSRVRPLTDREAHCLALAIKRGQSSGQQKPWTSGDMDRLKRFLSRGKKPAQIAILMSRTERAVWRKIYKEGLAVGKLCPRHIYTPSRLRHSSRVQSQDDE